MPKPGSRRGVLRRPRAAHAHPASWLGALLAGAVAWAACGPPPVYSRDSASQRTLTGGTWPAQDGGAETQPGTGGGPSTETGGHVGTGSGGTGGAIATGGVSVTGGHATGGSATGGSATGGAIATGGRGTGGATGGTSPATGGAPSTTGGSATGGSGTGGATGGMATGGAATGGAATGGAPAPTNRAPTVAAGADQSTTAPGPITLTGSASDDGLPNPPGALTTAWSSVSGPGTVTFGNANALTSTASFSAAGVYTLRLSVSDGALTTTDDLQVIVAAGGPCAGICSNPITANISMGYSSGGLGTGTGCFQVLGPINGGNCGNFTSPRTLHVNGVTEACDAGNWTTIPAVRNGGTCIDVTAGGQSFAFFTLW